MSTPERNNTLAIQLPDSFKNESRRINALSKQACDDLEIVGGKRHLTLLHLGRLPIRHQAEIIDVAAGYAEEIKGLTIVLQGAGDFCFYKNGDLVSLLYLKVQSTELLRIRKDLIVDLRGKNLLPRNPKNKKFKLHGSIGIVKLDNKDPQQPQRVMHLRQVLNRERLVVTNTELVFCRGSESIPVLGKPPVPEFLSKSQRKTLESRLTGVVI